MGRMNSDPHLSYQEVNRHGSELIDQEVKLYFMWTCEIN